MKDEKIMTKIEAFFGVENSNTGHRTNRASHEKLPNVRKSFGSMK